MTGTVIEELQASNPKPLPFAPSLDVRAFLLPRREGNLLVYTAPEVEWDGATIEDLGGIVRRYLNHHHEAMFLPDGVDAPLFVHERERDSVADRSHVQATFTKRHRLDADFEVIPTPGHTDGATAYLWDGGDHRFLFTGDTIYLREGEWIPAVLASSDRTKYLDSLDLIRELDFDVLVPWIASGGQDPYAVTDRADARRRIDAIIERIRGDAPL